MNLSRTALVLALAALASSQIPECEVVTKMKEDIKAAFVNDRFHPGTLRLGFHDCVDACDGCVNLNIGSNAGLKDPIDYLKKVYDAGQYGGVSVADFWSLATIVAVEHGIELSNAERGDGKKCPAFVLEPLFGRVDKSDCSTQTDDEFPNPKMTYAGMMEYFKKQLDMTEAEVVVLMGAHSLGGASPLASGYNGHFTGAKSRPHFDERYYSQMVDPTLSWKNENAEGPDKFVFNGYNGTTDVGKMMFNTDFEMFYDLDLDPATSATKCNLNHQCSGEDCAESDCKVSPMYDLSKGYAESCDKFVVDFAAALDKMMKHGAPSDLKPCTQAATTQQTVPTGETGTTDPTAPATTTESAATSLTTLRLGSLLLALIAILALH